MRLEQAIRAIASDLSGRDVSFALVGGLAVSARAEPRFTRDIDLAVAVGSDDEAEALIRWLVERGYQLRAQLAQDAAGRLAAVRLALPEEAAEPSAGPVVDLLFASSGIEAEIVAAADTLEILPGLRIATARIEHLLALKVLASDGSARAQDPADVQALLEVAEADDISLAVAALSLIAERGYSRGKDLVAEFDQLRQSR